MCLLKPNKENPRSGLDPLLLILSCQNNHRYSDCAIYQLFFMPALIFRAISIWNVESHSDTSFNCIPTLATALAQAAHVTFRKALRQDSRVKYHVASGVTWLKKEIKNPFHTKYLAEGLCLLKIAVFFCIVILDVIIRTQQFKASPCLSSKQ